MRRVLVSGAGIAGLTAACCLADSDWHVDVVEKAGAERTTGYMITFFGNGWKIAERMRLLSPIREFHYPAQDFQYVDGSGKPYFGISLDLVRKGFEQEYTYLRRPDLGRVLLERLNDLSVHVKYNTQAMAINESNGEVKVAFQNGEVNSYDIVIGADGVHSGVRKLVFGDESQFSRYLGYGVAAFQTKRRTEVGDSVLIYQEPNRSAVYYPVSGKTMDCVFLFSCVANRILKEDYTSVLSDIFSGSKWINQDVLQNLSKQSVDFFDVLKQIEMNSWRKGRVCLVGDACACLSPLAGQGASMGMLEAFILSNELKKNANVEEAFERYESLLKLDILRRQAQARNLAGRFVASSKREMIWNRWITRMQFSSFLVHRTANFFKGKIFQP
jgi:2-polyprenyl-6-methoxyphenol hydroxylase-like FAD-dependent oxidoreductase